VVEFLKRLRAGNLDKHRAEVNATASGYLNSMTSEVIEADINYSNPLVEVDAM
jgi:hypothetical protein